MPVAGPIVRLGGIKVCVDTRFSTSMQEALWGHRYENSELEIVRSQLTPADTVMELGTGLGLISTFCAKRIPSNRVFTFEANPALEPHIRRTYRLNRVRPRLEMCLVGSRNGRRAFHVHDDFWASTTVSFYSRTKTIIVPVRSFNDEVRRIQPTFLIIDIEGGEYELFRNAELCSVRRILIELHEGIIGRRKSQFVRDKLCEAGFRLQEKISVGNNLFWRRRVER